MIYNNVTFDIESKIKEPWRMCGEYKDGFSVTVGGNDEEDCMGILIGLSDKHGELIWYSAYSDGLRGWRVYWTRKFYLRLTSMKDKYSI